MQPTTRSLLAGVAAIAALAAPAARAQMLPRVTIVSDSVGAALAWDVTSRNELGYGLDLQLQPRTCRRLVTVGCPASDGRPPSALETIEALGPALGPVVVVDVGYNDPASGYADGLDQVMRALLDAGVQRVVWVTLEETQTVWVDINAQIRAAAGRWPQLVVADWAVEEAGHPWLVDNAHLNGDGSRAFARFLRPILLEQFEALPPPPFAVPDKSGVPF